MWQDSISKSWHGTWRPVTFYDVRPNGGAVPEMRRIEGCATQFDALQVVGLRMRQEQYVEDARRKTDGADGNRRVPDTSAA